MPFTALLLLAAVAQQSNSDPIVVTGNAWAPFISPMGEPFRSRAAGDDTFGRWFGQADSDANALLTGSEIESDAARFFASLDSDSDGQILPEELVAYESQVAPEIQVNTRWRDPRGDGKSTRGRDPRNSYDHRGLQGAARYSLLNIPQPVASADTDFNRAITGAEFRAAAIHRFRLLDRNGDQRLDLAELRAQLPPTRKDHRRAKKDAPDARVAVPVRISD